MDDEVPELADLPIDDRRRVRAVLGIAELPLPEKSDEAPPETSVAKVFPEEVMGERQGVGRDLRVRRAEDGEDLVAKLDRQPLVGVEVEDPGPPCGIEAGVLVGVDEAVRAAVVDDHPVAEIAGDLRGAIRALHVDDDDLVGEIELGDALPDLAGLVLHGEDDREALPR